MMIWLVWFICGFIASIINYKKYRTKRDIKEKYIGTEILLFICGCYGLFFITFRLLCSKYIKQD